MKSLMILLLLFLVPSYSESRAEVVGGSDKEKEHHNKLPDGPYVLYDEKGEMRVIRVDPEGVLRDTLYASLPAHFTLPVYSHKGEALFEVGLHPIKRQEWKNKARKKTLVISDPHGNWECFVSVLKGNGVIGENYEWTFGKNQLLIIGDVFDRGKDVLPIFWLIYKLEEEAEKAGGLVTFLLGNHEEMVMRNNLKYTDEMYKELAGCLGMEYSQLWGAESELGRWLQSKNMMHVIGKDLFVHAGLSKEFLEMELKPEQVNHTISASLFLDKEQRQSQSPLTAFLYGNQGPFWYRGMVMPSETYPAIDPADVEQLLRYYRVKRIFVGHTIFKDISLFFDGKVVAVNVNNKENKKHRRGRGVLIRSGKIYVIYDIKEPEVL